MQCIISSVPGGAGSVSVIGGLVPSYYLLGPFLWGGVILDVLLSIM